MSNRRQPSSSVWLGRVTEHLLLGTPSPRKRGQSLITGFPRIGKPHQPFPPHSSLIWRFSSFSEVVDIDTELLKPVAAKFNLSLTSFGKPITDPSLPSYGSVTLSNPWNTQLEPAPISQYKGSAAFDVLSGTIKGVYNTHRGLNGDDDIKVYPAYMTGNTGKTTRASYPEVGQ